MKVCFVSGYWGKNTDRVLGHRPDVYRHAYLFVWAVKMGTFHKPFYVITKDNKRYNIRQDNIGQARRLFGRFIAHQISINKWDDAAIVHVPSKCAVINSAEPRSLLMLQEALSHTSIGASLCDALRFSQRLSRAREGGERKRTELAPFMKVTSNVAGKRVVLVDDIVTRGGSMLASKDALEAAGAKVVGAVSCGHTMYNADILPFGRQEIELTDEMDDLGRLLS